MMTILGRVRAIWAVVLFLFMLLLWGAPVMLFNMAVTPGSRALQANVRFLHHVFAPVFLWLMGIRLEVQGREKLDPSQTYVLVGNHQSSLDFILNAVAFPGIFRFLAKRELGKIPVFGWVVRKLCLTVDRSSAMSRARSIVALKQELANGWNIFIYPEGGRNRTDAQLQPFYDGAFRLAIQTKAPLLMQTIVQLEKVMPSTQPMQLRRGTVRVVWDGPFETGNLKAADANQLKDDVYILMQKRLSE